MFDGSVVRENNIIEHPLQSALLGVKEPSHLSRGATAAHYFICS